MILQNFSEKKNWELNIWQKIQSIIKFLLFLFRRILSCAINYKNLCFHSYIIESIIGPVMKDCSILLSRNGRKITLGHFIEYHTVETPIWSFYRRINNTFVIKSTSFDIFVETANLQPNELRISDRENLEYVWRWWQ